MSSLLFMLALLAYVLVASVALAQLRSPPAWVRPTASLVLVVGVAAHLFGLTTLSIDTGHLPIFTAGASLCSLSAAVALGTLGVRARSRGAVLRGLLISLAAVLLGLGQLLPNEFAGADMPALASVWLPLHALSLLFGLGALGLAFGVGGAHLMMRRKLKAKKLSQLGGLPSLEILDRLNVTFVVMGFIGITVGIATGGMRAAALRGGNGIEPTVWITLLVWLWYGLGLGVRFVGGWRGPLLSRLSLVGFSGLLFSLVVVVVYQQGWHG